MFFTLGLCLLVCGFAAVQAADNICNVHQVTVSGEEKVIESPNYPSNYRSSVSCTARISADSNGCENALEFTIDDFLTESCCDRLVIIDDAAGNTLRTLKGTESSGTKIVVPSTRARLQFTTDGSVTNRGFSIRYRATINGAGVGSQGSTGVNGGTNRICSVSSSALGPVPTYFISPRYGNSSYPSNLDCSVSLCAVGSNIIRFKMHKMNLGEKKDIVTISNLSQTEIYTKFKGSEHIEPFFLPGGNYVLNLKTYPRVDGTDGILGFNLSAILYQSIHTVSTCESNQVNLLASESLKYINSPGFPHRQYDNSLRCSWLISTDDERHSVLKISVYNVTLEKDYDFLRVYDGDSTEGKLLESFTGSPNTEFPIISSGPDLFLVFTTDLKNAHDGFNISYSKILTIPKFSDVYNSTTNDKESTITVYFSSYFSIENVKWYKNGILIEEGESYQIRTDEKKIKNSEANHFESRLTINATEAQAAGVYRVSVNNERGYSDLSVVLNKRQSLPVITNIEKEVNIKNATVRVDFQSSPAYDSLEIYSFDGLTGQRVTNNSSPMPNAGEVYWIVTPSTSALDNDQYQLAVYITDLREFLLKMRFQLSIVNSAGTASMDTTLGYPNEAIPVLTEHVETQVKNNGAEIVVTFSSMLTPTYVQFIKDGIQIENSDKYRLIQSTLPPSLPPTQPSMAMPANVSIGLLHMLNYVNTTLSNASVVASSSDPAHPQGLEVFREAYTLKIKFLEMTDFGTYSVIVENSAGKAQSTFELPRAPVFPLKQSCNQFEDVSLTCSIESCTDHRIFWIHKSPLGDKRIRYLEGSQNGNVNELKIHAAEFVDSGVYTCSITRNKEGNFIANLPLNASKETHNLEEIQGGNVYLKVNGVPTISKSTVHFDERESVSVTVDFSSFPRYNSIRWYRNGVEMDTFSSNFFEVNTRPKNVSHFFYGKQVLVPGYSSSLTYKYDYHQYNDVYGLYKVSVENQAGHTTYFTYVQNPTEGVPRFNPTSVQTTYGNDICEVAIKVFSNPDPVRTVWLNKNSNDVTSDKRFVIETFALNSSQNSFLTKMMIQNVSVDDYNTYYVKVENNIGSSQWTFDLSNPNEDLPSIIGDVRISLTKNTALMEATFFSGPLHISISWLRNYNKLEDSDRYNMNSEESTSNPGTYVATLVITGVTEEDMGLYQIAVRNNVGQTIKSFVLDRGCEEES